MGIPPHYAFRPAETSGQVAESWRVAVEVAWCREPLRTLAPMTRSASRAAQC